MKKRWQAFTLIEMSLVLFIISLLVLLIVPNLVSQRSHAKEINDNALQTELNSQAQLYADDNDVDVASVTVDDLKAKGYLTAKQAKKIAADHLEIGNKNDN